MYACDFNATTPLHPAVAELLANLELQPMGNPSSPHASGRRAARLLDEARTAVADACDWPRSGVVFTSGASEALFIAIAGTIFGAPSDRCRVLVSSIEHKAVQSAISFAAKQCGKVVEHLPVTADGVINEARAAEAIGSDVALLCVMGANNETGVLQPLSALVELARRFGVPVLSDASQMPGKVRFSPLQVGVDLSVISGHKLMGPRGVGALLVDPSLKRQLTPVIAGGGQEGGFRGGTENVAAIAGFGLAMTLAQEELESRARVMSSARDAFEERLQSLIPDARIHGRGAERLPNTSFFCLPGLLADDLLHALPQLEASVGSACQSSVPSPSHVLLAMGIEPAEAEQSVRVSFGPRALDGSDNPHAAAAAGQQLAELIGSARQTLLEERGVRT